MPTGRTFTLGVQCPLTRLTKSKVVLVKQMENVSTSKTVITRKLSHRFQKPLTRYQRNNQPYQEVPGRTDRPLVFGFRLLKTYDGGSLTAQEFREKVHRDSSRGSNLYTISIEDMMKSSPIYLLSKASKNKSWLWHRGLNHVNFGTINDLARNDLVRGLPRLKFDKDHLCSACQLGKSKKHTHTPKAENTNLEVLNTLHVDLCGPIIFHQKLVPRTPQQNGVVERRKCTLVEAARTMLIFSKALMFLWAEAVATACYTQNRSLIHTRHNKTPYELVHDKKPDLTFF
ncbi:integrase, catalytic region, zinc finger, CCHC-type containing protein [Tanacetum coccineum]